MFEDFIQTKLSGATFAFYTDEEIEKISVKEITSSVAYDHLDRPIKGGICDSSLGVGQYDKNL